MNGWLKVSQFAEEEIAEVSVQCIVIVIEFGMQFATQKMLIKSLSNNVKEVRYLFDFIGLKIILIGAAT